MKKICILLFVVVAFLSCESEIEEDLLQEENTSFLTVEEETVNFTQDTIYIPAKDGGKIALLKYDEKFYSWGDMLLNKAQIEYLSTSNRGVAISDVSKRWEDLVIPYRFHPNYSSVSETRQAISRMESKLTCINFVELSSNGTASSYIEFRDTSDPAIRGSSALGRQGGQQIIRINPNNTVSSERIGVVVHEMGHALGLFHEQQHPNRDNYIIVNFGNIPLGACQNQFNIPMNQVTVGDFDFGSVMLYNSFQCSSNSGFSMTDLNGTPFDAQRTNFSYKDAEIIAITHGYNYSSRLNNMSFNTVLIDFESSQDTQYREEEFYLNFSSNLISPLVVNYEIVETVSNIQTHPSGQQTTITNHTITLPAGQSSYLITTLVTLDQYYDFGEPDGPQYTRSTNLLDNCSPVFRR